MLTSRRGSGSALPAAKVTLLIGTLIAASAALSTVQAAALGHSRIVSAPGQPLHIEIPVTELTQPEIESLRATPAPASAWQAAGMTPPVPLDSMRLMLLDGYRPGVKVIQLRSEQVSGQPIVDVLLDIRSASGQQRYQVSLLAHADPYTLRRAGGETARNPRVIDGRGDPVAPASHPAAGTQIRVQAGDNMFGIAQQYAVRGVSVYQLMIALQRANPRAFIQDNVNLVRAGATLTMPDMDALTALSDLEARRIFQQHAQAFARYRQRSGGADVAAVSTAGEAVAQGAVSVTPVAPSAAQAAAAPGGGDRLRLSGAGPGSGTISGTNSGTNSGTGMAPGAETPSGSAASASPNDAGQAAGQGGSTSGVSGDGRASGAQAADVSAGATGPRADAASNGVAIHGAAENGRAQGASASGGTAGGQPPVSMLASSGAIASDAAHEDHSRDEADASGSGAAESRAEGSGTAGSGAADSTHPDDEAATRKGMDESRTRILELEDNVRHLNEALQKQGHVAAEAALEGARSVTEAIKEAIGLSDDEPADATASTPGSASPGGAAGQAAAEPGASGTGVGSPTNGPGGSDPRPDVVNGASESAGASPAGAVQGLPDGSTAAPASGQAAGTSSPASPLSGQSAPSAQTATPSGQSATPSAQTATPSGQAAPSSSGEQKHVSWFQENIFAVIGGGLLLIVLIVAWVLRRIGASERNAFESDSPITDSMVREKLRDIDLELDQSPSGGGGRHST